MTTNELVRNVHASVAVQTHAHHAHMIVDVGPQSLSPACVG